MKCPFCGYTESKVIDTRPADEGEKIRRRRECLRCGRRFTSYEAVETTPLVVIKRDGSRQEFSRDKVLRSMLKSCEKRSVSMSALEQAADEIESALRNRLEPEIPSSAIGEQCMEKLRKIDQVAYIRFASVYRQFKDINSFLAELQRIVRQDQESKTGGKPSDD